MKLISSNLSIGAKIYGRSTSAYQKQIFGSTSNDHNSSYTMIWICRDLARADVLLGPPVVGVGGSGSSVASLGWGCWIVADRWRQCNEKNTGRERGGQEVEGEGRKRGGGEGVLGKLYLLTGCGGWSGQGHAVESGGWSASAWDGSSASLEEEMHNISSLGSARSFSLNCNQMEDTNGEAGKDPLWNPISVPKRMRAELRHCILSPVERLQRQLYNNQ
ncbi:hypothetical protein BC332_34150 [Capsicum chinense]|nr:hypothetical protein BC332_34150 [Capsicum chinense]